MTRAILFFLLCLPIALADASQRIPRSHAEKIRFAREHPCPATGKPTPSCPGYVLDHVVPLCAGGPDKASNMQWQSKADAKAKDRLERRMCRHK
jgi:hypothetical protein